MTTTATTSPSLQRFRRHVAALAGIYYRLDRGQAGGRNSGATEAAIAHHMAGAQAVLRAAGDDDALWAYLDGPRGARLAATWNRIERRHAGLI